MTRPLSEKAKGKQRAIPSQNEHPLSTNPVDTQGKGKGKERATNGTGEREERAELSRELIIRFTEGFPDLLIRVKEKETVREVKNNIRISRPELSTRRLRLIHSGRLLTDGTCLYGWLVSLEERQRRAVSQTGSEVDGLMQSWAEVDGEVKTGGGGVATLLHCSVGPELSEGEPDEGGDQQANQIKPLRGFDRLAAAGFSGEDIANIRRQFHDSSNEDYLESDYVDEEDLDEHARALEEQWIDSLDTPSSAVSSSSSPSPSTTILQGMIIGFFFPIMPLFWFREHKPAIFWEEEGTAGERREGSVVFSKRMQMGLVVGFLINFSFGLWRYLLTG
ncbi:hypothetical protein JAAARDRAFT_190093 [Jaapia argillacea MUCL 33604]|uniref:Ubiquitin-like domain-containing protein n=1 Tax=Jaapia argillacea MUCL 33604 TaxID=933084 RepID=A0A067Q9I5_9AGAM|nr:hypothetical protein JAAARDRAFT_190093 [Jaapia argillacea MUCL 33604]